MMILICAITLPFCFTRYIFKLFYESIYRLEQEQAANKRLQEKLRSVERRLNEKENLYVIVSSERLELQNHLKDLEAQLDELELKLAKDKEQLEKEIIGRIDAENRYQTLKEESQFNAQVHIKVSCFMFLSVWSVSPTLGGMFFLKHLVDGGWRGCHFNI